jgi:hypothetical protein
MASFKKKLNKTDLAHFKEMSDAGTVTIANLKAALAVQECSGLKCEKCRNIARKLGIAI